MLNQMDVLVHLEHYEDLLREAEQERLARLASPTQVKKTAEKTKIQKNVRFVETACCNPAELTCCPA